MPTIKHRRATRAQWLMRNPVLNAGELGFEMDTNRFKIGNGVSNWNLLKYFINEDDINIDVGRLSQESLDAAYSPDSVELRSLYNPIDELYPSDKLISDEYISAAPTDYANQAAVSLLDKRLNYQGSVPTLVEGSPGVINMSSGRSTGSILGVGFQTSSDKVDIMMQGFGYLDTTVYVSDAGKLKKLRPYPLATDRQGYFFRSMRFEDRENRIFWVKLPYIYFLQVVYEGTSPFTKAPDRRIMPVTGDSFVDASSAYNPGSERTFITHGIPDVLEERTGFIIPRLGQGGSGRFNNGAGVDSENGGPYNTSRYYSSSRRAAMARWLGITAKPLAVVTNGSANDGELSGGRARMRDRILEDYRWLNSVDPLATAITVGPEPLNDNGIDPTNPNAINRLGYLDAIAQLRNEIPRLSWPYLDPNHPEESWWSGVGYESGGVLNGTSSAASIIGADQIHGNWEGYEYFGGRIADEAGPTLIPARRALGMA